MLAKTGPGTNWKMRRPSSVSCKMSVPVMSIGIRSGVNWIRLKLSERVSASLLTRRVLASPGTPISSAWPRENMQIANRSIVRSCPTMTRASSALSRE